MRTSESLSTLTAALAKVTPKLSHPHKNAVNPHLKNRFADLLATIEANRKTLADAGLFVNQFAEAVFRDGQALAVVVTRLSHESGEFMESTAELPFGEQRGLNLPQSYGVVVSYLRRYGLSAILGLAADEDQDGGEGGNGESRKQAATNRLQQAAANSNSQSAKATEDQLNHIDALVRDTESDIAAMCKHYKVRKVTDLTTAQAQHAIAALKRKQADAQRQTAGVA